MVLVLAMRVLKPRLLHFVVDFEGERPYTVIGPLHGRSINCQSWEVHHEAKGLSCFGVIGIAVRLRDISRTG